jgi:predicted dehydrogenase
LFDTRQKVGHYGQVLKEDARHLAPSPRIETQPVTRRSALRVGIVGGGFMGRVHGHAARSAGADVVGAVGSNASRAEAARTATGAQQGYADVDRMLAEAELDVLHVCAPNELHLPLSRKAAEAGVHIVCEKPLSSSAASAQVLARAAADAGVLGFVPFVYRFHPMVREMAARLADGDAGAVALVTGSYLQDWLADADSTNWRVDANAGGASRVFADIGSHWFDMLEFVRGVRVARVSARFATLFPSRGDDARVQTEDTCTVQFEMTDGVLGTFAASQVARGRKNRLAIEVSGDTQSYAFDQENAEALWVGDAGGNRIALRDPVTLRPEAARLAVLPAGHAQGYQDCFNAFVADAYATIGGESRDGLPTFADGLRSATIVDEIVTSARSDGAWRTIPIEGEGR